MERRPSPRCGARGGEDIPAKRASRARVAVGAAAVAIAAATGMWVAVLAEDGYLVRATLLATVLAAALLAAALVLQRPVVIPGVITLLAAPYVALVAFETEALDDRAPIVAALLFVVAELAYWSLELRSALADEAGTYLRRLSVLAGLALATVLGGTAVLALVAAVGARGTGVEVVGAAAALAAVALLALAAGSRRDVR